ncbi:ABC1 kinase family protein [Senegalia massiliensis]|uniref:Ubiquinone biosynthesis protein UbiB n=1 Tax=Senegalia massiliensis TaxID=1720316 RepID=A0A845R303_9CLOT|nr:AarF/UbiB family protein [Senegalia massiliensis]NBI06933.1 ubiquinone biosynthesis protein UbiB [Senegalia massiliensis]
MIKNRVSKIHRYKEIYNILTKYGFSMIAGKLPNRIFFRKIFFRKSSKLSSKYSRGKRLRMAIEELGPTYIKLGQVMSTRYDLLPTDIIEELSKLQDQVSEYPLVDAKRLFKEEIGIDISDAFMEFDEKPLAAASIGQVYNAKLFSGEDIVVKIRRPNIKNLIEKDLEILKTIGGIVDDYIVRKSVVSFSEIVDEFATTLRRELDYTMEAQNYENFRQALRDNRYAVVPKVYWDFITKKVLVISKLKGIKINDTQSLFENNYDNEKIAYNLAKTYMEQVFLHGFFHADPHPGNLFVINGEKIGFVDFGMVGYLDDESTKLLMLLLKSSVDKNSEKIVETLYKMDSIPETTNKMLFKRDINYVLNYYYNLSFDKIDFSDALTDILRITYKHKVRVPSQLTLLIKTIISIEGTAKNLNPKFNLTDVSKDLLESIKKDKFNTKRLFNKTYSSAYNMLEDFREIPKMLNTIFYKISNDKIKLNMNHEGLSKFRRELNAVTNKLSLSIIISAIIIGSSTIAQAKTGPQILEMSAIGLVGFLLAGIMGIILIVSIIFHSWDNKK